MLPKNNQALLKIFLVSLATMLASCGGGGGGGTGGTTTTSTSAGGPSGPWPNGGNYAAVLRVSGTTATGGLRTALNFVHASNKNAIYLIDNAAAKSELGFSLESGTYDAGSKQISTIPIAFVDAPNGAVRVTSQIANGVRPAQNQAAALALCPGSMLANHYSSPFSSEVVINSPGADTVCGTADDTQRLVRFSPAGAPAVGAEDFISKSVGFFRSTTSGDPTHWVQVHSNGEVFGNPLGGGSKVILRGAGTPATNTKPLGAFLDVVLFTQNGVLHSATGAAVVQPVKQLSSLTGPDGWKLAGSDANRIFVYMNSNAANSGTGTWTLLSISRATQAVTVLATGTGSIFAADAVSNAVFLSQLSGSSFSIQRFSLTLSTMSVFDGPGTTHARFVTKVAGDVSLRVSVAVSDSSLTTDVIDTSNGAILRAGADTIIHGFETSQFDTLTGSVVPSAVLLASPYRSSFGYSGASLTFFYPASKTGITVGPVATNTQLEGSPADQVLLTPFNLIRAFGGTEARRISGGQFTGPSKLYTVDSITGSPVLREISTFIF